MTQYDFIIENQRQFRHNNHDEFLIGFEYGDVVRLNKAYLAAKEFIESHAADPDITSEMRRTYSNYLAAVEVLEN